MATATPTEQERRWNEAVERYHARYGPDGAAILEARAAVFQELAVRGPNDRSRAIGRAWLMRHGASELTGAEWERAVGGSVRLMVEIPDTIPTKTLAEVARPHE